MRHTHAAINLNTRHHIGALFGRLLLSTGSALIVLVTTTLAWGDNYAPQMIVPGIGIGPARLGMTEAQARRALAASHLSWPGCAVDVLIGQGRAIALGTRFGGCLEVPLPPSVGRLIVSGRTVLPEVAGIGGSPAPFVRAFGDPTRFRIDPQIAILLWANGLVARTAETGPGEIITYLAVVPANSVVPPYALLVPGAYLSMDLRFLQDNGG